MFGSQKILIYLTHKKLSVVTQLGLAHLVYIPPHDLKVKGAKFTK